MIFGFSTVGEVYVYATCVLLGVSMLMPVNAVTSAPRYMVEYYRYVTGDPEAEPNVPVFWANILTFYNVVSLVTQIICGPTVLTRAARSLSLTTRFILAITLMMVEIFVIVVMPTGHVSQNGAITAFIIVSIVAGAGKSYLEATCYALVSSMPSKFMSAVMFGCALSGVIASTMQCIIKASMEDTYESAITQSHIYFSLTLAIMFITLLMVVSLRFNMYAQSHVAEFRMLGRDADDVDLAGSRSTATGNAEPINDTEKQRVEDPLATGEDAAKTTNDTNVAVDESRMTTSQQLLATSVMPVVRLIYPMQIACFCVFFLSLFIFPSLIIPIDRDDNWFATIAILMYNCGDALGRFCTTFRRLWPSRRAMLYMSFLRFLFLPLIFLCIYEYIPGHVPPYIFLFLVGLTNYLGALTMVKGPITDGLKTDGQRVMAGQLMGISLLGGASFASLIAIGIVFVLP